jgi:hypothetical protein
VRRFPGLAVTGRITGYHIGVGSRQGTGPRPSNNTRQKREHHEARGIPMITATSDGRPDRATAAGGQQRAARHGEMVMMEADASPSSCPPNAPDQQWARALIRVAIADTEEVARGLTDLMAREIPGVRGSDAQAYDMLLESVHSNVAAIYDVFDRATDPKDDAAPAAALAYARFLAQRNVPLAALLRAYRLGHARFLSRCLQMRESSDLSEAPQATVAFVDRCAAYIDRVAEEVGAAYEIERERWISRRSVRRQRCVNELLAGDRVGTDEASHALGYDLTQTHIALEAWLPALALSEDDHAFDTLLQALGTLPGITGRSLFVPIDDRDARLWLPIDPSRFDATNMSQMVDARQLAVRLAIGEPAPGLEGFRRSHRQALAVRRVMEISTDPVHCLSFRRIGPVALLCHDLEGLRDWVASVLGPLAADDERCAWLRDSLFVFLDVGSSFAAAAERLHIHRNTVQYRVQQAIEARGRSLDNDRYDTYLALRACRWLPAQALQQAAIE